MKWFQDEVATAESSFSPSPSSSSDEDDTRTPETDDTNETRLSYRAAMTLKQDIVTTVIQSD